MGTTDTETTQEVEATPKRSPKNRRKPWKKRVRNFLLSPVHLIRRHMFRKNPSRRRTSDSKVNRDEDTQTKVIMDAAVQSAKQRKIPCYFLFLGVSKAGKSTTISKLFNGERPKQQEPSAIKVHHNSFVGNNVGIKVVDTPGLLGSNTEDQDERVITAIRSFLKRDLPTRIPTVTFITARLTTSVDEELAQFTQMLKELSTIRKYITDECCSNVVLLLTHSQSVEKPSEEGLYTIIAKYQEAFSKIFPSANCPIPTIAVENFRRNKNQDTNAIRYHDIVFEGLRSFAELRKSHTLLSMAKWLSDAPRRFSVAFEPVVFPISQFSEGANFSVSSTSSSSGPHANFNHSDSGSDTDCETKEHLNCEPYYVQYEVKEVASKSTKKRNKSRKGQNAKANEFEENTQGLVSFIPEGSQVMLSNKTLLKIEDCLVGDKLLGINPTRPSVITGIGRRGDDITSKNTSVGTLYCSVKMSSESDDESRKQDAKKMIYSYQNEAFLAVDATKANVPEMQQNKHLYFLELDTPDATFILNGFPCFSKTNNIIS